MSLDGWVFHCETGSIDAAGSFVTTFSFSFESCDGIIAEGVDREAWQPFSTPRLGGYRH